MNYGFRLFFKNKKNTHLLGIKKGKYKIHEITHFINNLIVIEFSLSYQRAVN